MYIEAFDNTKSENAKKRLDFVYLSENSRGKIKAEQEKAEIKGREEFPMAEFKVEPKCCFWKDTENFPGVQKVADQVRQDIFLVTDYYPEEYRAGESCENLILYGTAGKSRMLEMLEQSGKISLEKIRGKWEAYGFFIVDNPFPEVEHGLVIAGSDKRGTIYGLYHLSEKMGVSPLVNWNHVWPEKKHRVIFTGEDSFISREPSVKYRGFFINDEWPAFGTWAEKHFGGINAKCYERVFELLLRLKGNYLWPAMWNSNFSLDGPGLDSAKLADEYGVVMSTSHHEPCMRSGEEFTLFSGQSDPDEEGKYPYGRKTSPYGKDWDFRRNEEGITAFWRDGLERNKNFENVITLGMRGERDSAILGKEATLEDNIQLLRDVLKTQNRLIRETVNENLDEVPRQIVLFTEVEEFFYGNREVKGLMGDAELEGVTLMLSDNNFGYTRTLPTKEMREHKGGFGMYYHMDMHGGAYSYQWIGSSYLPRIWEQMTQAYEFGVREIWVTNIGDIGTQEYGLSFFLDLAYDCERWGGRDCRVTKEYTKQWTEKQFGAFWGREELKKAEEMLWGYTGLLAKRKHEIMNASIYHPVHFGEAEEILQISEKLLQTAEELKAICPEKNRSAFQALLYYPVCGTANLMKMWILAGRNELYAKQNKIEANLLVKEIENCVREDARLIAEYEHVDGGYYDGFGSSEHIGFTNWNDEDNKYPVRHLIYPASRPRMLLQRVWDEAYMTGLYWCDRPQIWRDALRQDVTEIQFEISSGSEIPFSYRIETDCPWMEFSKEEGEVSVKDRVTLFIRRDKFCQKVTGEFRVIAAGIGEARVTVEAENEERKDGMDAEKRFRERDGYIAMEASHYHRKTDTDRGAFQILTPYGRSGSAIKVFPVTMDFTKERERPFVEYHFMAEEAGYHLCFYLAPTTPVVFEREQYIGYSINEEAVRIVNTVERPEIPFFLSPQWEREAMDCIKKTEVLVQCRKGENRLRFYGMSPAIVLERILLWKEGISLPESYLGPVESEQY